MVTSSSQYSQVESNPFMTSIAASHSQDMLTPTSPHEPRCCYEHDTGDAVTLCVRRCCPGPCKGSDTLQGGSSKAAVATFALDTGQLKDEVCSSSAIAVGWARQPLKHIQGLRRWDWHGLGLFEQIWQGNPMQAVGWGWCVCVSSESHGLGRSAVLQRHSRALASEGCRQKQRCQNALLRTSPLPSGGPIAVEGSHGNEGLLLGRPPEEPDQPITENSLLEVLDGIVMMYNLSVHQQLGKVSRNPFPQPPRFYTDFLFSAY